MKGKEKKEINLRIENANGSESGKGVIRKDRHSGFKRTVSRDNPCPF